MGVINYIVSEWNRSGNPAWLKAMMLIAVVAVLVFISSKLKVMLAGKGEIFGEGEGHVG